MLFLILRRWILHEFEDRETCLWSCLCFVSDGQEKRFHFCPGMSSTNRRGATVVSPHQIPCRKYKGCNARAVNRNEKALHQSWLSETFAGFEGMLIKYRLRISMNGSFVC
ncbi:hypothetical protein ANCCAN_23969 [Ancylostoma caninum]|uniref:Uncharacterized protein n=1 Tax=Ancylostoma caninum TaxID=29170 RepID=A0A368FDP6_ANCCA|nr:hypothetical protein ANCCAN_23969 [Ancylostoma caninum]